MPEPFIGQWSSGEPIDITGVPLVRAERAGLGVSLVAPYEATNGGGFHAIYRFHERRSNDCWIYELARVEELMPPTPPQIQGFGNDVRLPMMDRGGFSAHLEAEQRKREWAEARR